MDYPWPSTVHVTDFISTKLCFDEESSNYEIWKEQLLCLIEGQDLLGFIDGSIIPPLPETEYENYRLWRRSDRLLKGWILGSLDEELLSQVSSMAMATARDVWLELDNKFSQLTQQLQLQQQPQNTDFGGSVPLYKAVLEGNWNAAKSIFDRDPAAKIAAITSTNETPLSIAVGTGQETHFVQKMVEIMPDDAIAQTLSDGSTLLHVAAAVGNIEAATILVKRMPSLLHTPDFSTYGLFPLQRASSYAHRRMVEYLISVTKEQTPYAGMAGLTLLTDLITVEFYDIALNVVSTYPHLAKLTLPNGASALSEIARKTNVFPGGYHFGFWERFIPIRRTTLEKQMMMNQKAQNLAKCLCSEMESTAVKEANQAVYDEAMCTAVAVGNSDLVEMIVEAYPDAIRTLFTSACRTVFHLAVEHRSERVFNLVYQMGCFKLVLLNYEDIYTNNLLHAAAIQGPSHKLNQISGAALQLQRELQWYKEVEKFVQPNKKELRNNEDLTPPMLFTESHKELKEAGEKWMKDTSASYTIAAALIATVMFAAAITVPGGNDGTTGLPVFSKDIKFVIFSISNVVSLFTSTTSLLMFLAILTSRYAEEDFLHALPKRLIIGLGTLFISVTFMMVAFSVTIHLVFGQKRAWVLITVAALSCLPVTSFVLLQYPLLIDLISSTYGRGIFGKQSDRPLCGNSLGNHAPLGGIRKWLKSLSKLMMFKNKI